MKKNPQIHTGYKLPGLIRWNCPAILLLILFITSAQLIAQNPLTEFTGSELILEKLYQAPKSDASRDSADWPPIWDIPQENATLDPHFAIVMAEANPRINDIPLQPGDYIGGFYTDDYGELRCGGAEIWNGGSITAIKLYADDPDSPEKDGFAYGELINYKFFSWTTIKEYLVDTIDYLDPGPLPQNIWFPLGISQIINMQAFVDMDFYIQASENPICIGSQLQLSAEEFIGTGGPYAFDWTSEPPGFISDLQVPPPFYPTETMIFQLTVQDENFTSYHALTVTVNELPQANAGPDSIVCSNEAHQLNGSASNYAYIIWSSSGDGAFSYTDSLNAIYSPGDQDIQNGFVSLTLFAQSLPPCTLTVTDTMQLQVLPPPGIDPGDDRTVCETEPISLSANAQHYDTISWTTSGDGVFTDPNTDETQYLPGPTDILDGEVNISVCANALEPCILTACDDFDLFFAPGPTCNAPSNRTSCGDFPIPMAGTASNNEGIIWTTQGDGYFIDSTVMNTDYVPGPIDLENGGTTVTLHALAINPCSFQAAKDVTIIIYEMPEVDAGNDTITCGEAELSGIAEEYSSIFWSTQGDGYFSNSSSLNPIYYPGEQDINLQAVELILTAQPIFPCLIIAEDTMSLFINIPKILSDNLTDTVLGPGDALVFEFSAQSILQGNYSWYFNGELMEAQFSSSLTIDSVLPGNAGYYQARYLNDCGEVESEIALVEIHESYTHQNVLPQGWSGISSFVNPDALAIDEIFSEIIDDLVILVDDAGHIYWPDQNINTMNDWSVTEGYKIKMENSAVLNIEGKIIWPLQEIAIPSGWSYLPVNTTCSVEVEELFSEFPEIIVIYEIAGPGIYWPDQGINTLQVLNPGKSYNILNSGSPISIRFPVCSLPDGE